ncbi:serine/threonine protein kinase, partial [Candidatus Sumerlaeota bacterium]|nr:serine/threonine protein kinase [Candidatus Sumerlaeota bacterium]
TGQLEHPNIVPVHDLGVDAQGRVYFTMKRVQGRSLRQILHGLAEGDPDTAAKYPLSELLTIFQKICDAISFAHSRRIIHRDLKPANIMVGEFGEALVMDWGLARFLDREDIDTEEVKKELEDSSGFERSIDGKVVGTPSYMPPEQVRGRTEEIDERSDVYSLGAILYEILTFRPPYMGESIGEIFSKVAGAQLDDPRREARKRKRYCSPELAAICRKALSADKDARYQSAESLRIDVRRYLEGYSVSAKQDLMVVQLFKLMRRNMGISITAGVALMLFMIFTALFMMQLSAEKQDAVDARDDTLKANEKLVAARRKLEANYDALQREKELQEQAFYANNIVLAQISLEEGNSQRVRELLDACPPAQRGFEWGWLRSAANLPLREFHPHDDLIYSVEYSPDGTKLLTASKDGTCKVLDAATGEVLATFDGHEGPVETAVWSPQGDLIASGGWDKTIYLWRPEDAAWIRTFKAHRAPIEQIIFSENGKRFTSVGGYDGRAVIWDVQTGGMLILKDLTQTINAVLFNSDLEFVLGLENGDIVQMDQKLQSIQRTIYHHTDGITCFDKSTFPYLLPFFFKNMSEDEIHTNLKERYSFVAGSWDGALIFFDVGMVCPVPQAHHGAVWGIDFLAYNHVVSVGEDSNIIHWSCPELDEENQLVSKPKPLYSIHAPDNTRSLDVDQSSSHIVTTGQAVQIWDQWSGASRSELIALENAGFVDCGFSEDGHGLRANIAGENGRRYSWTSITGGQITVEKIMPPEGSKQALLDSIATSQSVTVRVVSSDGGMIASGNADGTISLWNRQTGAHIAALNGHADSVFALAFSPDGAMLASGSRDRTIRIWDAKTGQPLRTLEGHAQRVSCLAWSPDGQRLVSGAWDAQLKLWNPESGRELLTLRGHTDNVNACAFCPAGRMILSAGEDGRVFLWRSIRFD